MSRFQHQSLAAGRWSEMSFAEQMANIGSEVSRALNWRNKDRSDFSQHAFFRALELLDLSLMCADRLPKLKELTRTREVLVDFFFAENQFQSSGESLMKYFDAFARAARRDSWGAEKPNL